MFFTDKATLAAMLTCAAIIGAVGACSHRLKMNESGRLLPPETNGPCVCCAGAVLHGHDTDPVRSQVGRSRPIPAGWLGWLSTSGR